MSQVYPISRKLLFPLIRFFVKRVTGWEHLPAAGPYVIASKHLGPLDAFFIYAEIVPRINEKVHFMANNAKWGWFWEKVVSEQWAGTIPYYHKNPRLSLQIADTYLKQGHVIGIFPEGILQEYDEHRRRAKTGAARLAIWNHVPIVPIGLMHDVTVRPDLPRMQRRRQVIRNMLYNPHALEIHIGPAFTLERYYDQPLTRELLQNATNDIMDHIDERSRINRK